MRKSLKLFIDDKNPNEAYGLDRENNIVLYPENFRSTVVTSIKEGKFKDGDIFQVDIDEKSGNPIKRSIDGTVAIHKPFERRYVLRDIINIVNKAVELTKRGKSFVIEDLLK